MRYSGPISDVLVEGKHGHADIVQISYDELDDLTRQAGLLARLSADVPGGDLVREVERQTKLPLHPALGGHELYELDPRMLFELPIQ